MATNPSVRRASARVRLRAALEMERGILAELIERADDAGVPDAQLVDSVEALESIDFHVGELIAELRMEASSARLQREDRPVRHFVIAALDEIGAPQGAAFVHDYLWARHRVDMDTRGFSALRRDERRSWERNSKRRLAYIVPALSTDGTAVPKLMARSDWPLEQRLVVPTDERLFNLRRLQALFAARQDVEAEDGPDPFQPLIAKYAPEAFAEPPVFPVDPAGQAAAIARLGRRVDAEYAEVHAATALQREQAVSRLRKLPQTQRLWGAS